MATLFHYNQPALTRSEQESKLRHAEQQREKQANRWQTTYSFKLYFNVKRQPRPEPARETRTQRNARINNERVPAVS